MGSTDVVHEWANINPWIDVESTNCGLLTLKNCPFVNYKEAKLEVQDNFIVQNTLLIMTSGT